MFCIAQHINSHISGDWPWKYNKVKCKILNYRCSLFEPIVKDDFVSFKPGDISWLTAWNIFVPKVSSGYSERTVFKPTRYCGVLENTMRGPRIIVKFFWKLWKCPSQGNHWENTVHKVKLVHTFRYRVVLAQIHLTFYIRKIKTIFYAVLIPILSCFVGSGQK